MRSSIEKNGRGVWNAAAFLFSFILLALPCSAKIFIPASKLESLGIQPSNFSITNLAGAGKLLVGKEKIKNPDMLKKGIPSELRVFRLGPHGLLKMETIPIPAAKIDQLELDADGKTLAMETQDGADFYIVDFTRKTVNRFFHHLPGEAGFRGGPPVIQWADGHFYFQGRFYDRSGATVQHVLARLDFEPGGKFAFKQIFNDDLLRSHLPGAPTGWEYIPPDEATFIVLSKLKTGMTYALVVAKQDNMRIVDQGLAYGGVSAAHDRVLYSVKRGQNKRETDLVDFSQKEITRWKIDGNEPYTYLFLSKDGRTVVLTRMDFSGSRMSMYYGREKDNFSLKPVPELQNVADGTFRYDPDGKHWAFYNPDGITVGTLP